ncbi:MAG: Ig-like domain-containing protein [Bacilli bacterium]|nr:Ig-like domain-containing protein [Bacilli bacterium]
MKQTKLLLPLMLSALLLSGCALTNNGSQNNTNTNTNNTDNPSDPQTPVEETLTPNASIAVNSTLTTGNKWSMTPSSFKYDGIELTKVSCTGLYGTGEKSIRFGNSTKAGSLSFTFESAVIRGVILTLTSYGEDASKVKVATSANTTGETLDIASDVTTLNFTTFKNDSNASTTLTIATAADAPCRFYLEKIDLVIKEPDPIYATSLTIYGESSVYAGKYTTLTVGFTPETTNRKAITWSSSNNAIATVEDGVVTGVTPGNVVITASAEGANNTTVSASVSMIVEEQALDEWTILMYVCGADLESGSGLATSDLKEIASVSGQPDDVNIVVEAGGASSWNSTYSSVISSSKLNRFHLENKKYVKDEQITRASMGKASTLQSFLEWGLTTYPAQKTALILWNHGGAQFGCCYDENYNDDALTDNEVVSALNGAYATTGTTKLEWIGYDCCLMQVQEVAEFNSPYFNYMVAAEESEAGYGWDYDNWVDDLYAGDDTETILTEICKTFIDDNGGVNAEGEYYYGTYYAADQTLSFLDLNKMAAYKEAWEAMAGALKDKITSSNAKNFRTNVMGKVKYFAGSDYYYFSTFDAYHFLTILGNNSTFNPGASYINACKEAFNDLVIYNCAQQDAAHDAYGLALFFPASTNNGQMNYCTSTYSNFTNWNYICSNYGGSFTSSYTY